MTQKHASKQAASKAKPQTKSKPTVASVERSHSDWPSNPGKAMRANGHVLISVWGSAALRDAIHDRARATGKFHSDVIRQTLGAAAEKWSGMAEGTLQTLRPLVPSNVPRATAKAKKATTKAAPKALAKALKKGIANGEKKLAAATVKSASVSTKKDNGKGAKARSSTKVVVKGGKGAQNARKRPSAARGGTKSGAGVGVGVGIMPGADAVGAQSAPGIEGAEE